MFLRSTLTSPFGRKVRMGLLRLEMDVEIAPGDPLVADDPLRRENPLGKMPVLTLDCGKYLYDSRVILEYLDALKGGGALLSGDPQARFDALTLQSLADGIMDAALLIVYEARHRPEALRHEPWLYYQRGKILRGLEALAADLPDASAFHVGTISVSCMLGYLDWRRQVDWRATHPSLVVWLDEFRRTHSEFDRTAAP